MTKTPSLLKTLSSKASTIYKAAWFLWFPLAAALFYWRGSIWVVWLACIALAATCVALSFWVQQTRERHIREGALPRFLRDKVLKAYPHLSNRDFDLIERGMRQFFLACARSKGQFVSMPSKAVDTLWHEFILHTKAYSYWCNQSLGCFLHHTPAAALGTKAKNNDGLRRAWFWACKDEAINPKAPSRLPLLFALDAKLAIEGGYSYVADCKDIHRKSDASGSAASPYCGTDFSNGSHSSSSSNDDFGGADNSSDGGDGGDGGGGCGGGD